MSLQAAPLPAALVQFCMAVTQISGNQWNHRKRKVEQRDDWCYWSLRILFSAVINCSDLGDLVRKGKIPIPGCKRQPHLSKVYCLILLLHCSKYNKGKIQIKLQKQTCCIEQTGKCPVFHQWNLYLQPWKAFQLIPLAHPLCMLQWVASIWKARYAQPSEMGILSILQRAPTSE